MSAEELAAMDAKIVADTIAEMQRQIEQLTGARHSMYDPAVAIARDIANRTPPAMSADHIGDAGNMVAPVEAVAWRVSRRKEDAGFGRPQVFTTDDASEADMKQWRGNGYEVQPLYTHPAPIKPSGDTGELRERVARIVDPLSWRRFDRRPPYAAHIPRETQIEWVGALQPSLGKADTILDLIQSERAG